MRVDAKNILIVAVLGVPLSGAASTAAHAAANHVVPAHAPAADKARLKAHVISTKTAASAAKAPAKAHARVVQAGAAGSKAPAHATANLKTHGQPHAKAAPTLARAEAMPAVDREPEVDQEALRATHNRKLHHAPQAVETPQPEARHHAARLGREAMPAVIAVSYSRRGKLVVPPALKGSHEILVHQNEMADLDGLDRVQDDDDLDDMRESGLLVAIPATPGLIVDDRLPDNRRYARPWTAQFLSALGRAYYARFHQALQVNSAVRTVEFQQRLILTNGNAAPAEGETASPHLTGQAVDLGKHGLSMAQIGWLRGYLLPLVDAGKVDVEEEFQQACFHISVYRKYVPEPVKREIAQEHSAAAVVAAQ